VAAAFRDPRFMPLTRENSTTSGLRFPCCQPTEALAVASEEHALATLRPGIDGVVFEYGHYRSTFLPQVWEQLPERPSSRTPEAQGRPVDGFLV